MSSQNEKLVLGDLVSLFCKSENHYTRLQELEHKQEKTEEEMLEQDVLNLNYNFLNCKQFLNFPANWKIFFS